MSKREKPPQATQQPLNDEEDRQYDIAWIVQQNIFKGINEREVYRHVGEAWGLSARKVAHIYKKLKDDLAPPPEAASPQESPSQKKQTEQPRHKRAKLRYTFDGGDAEKVQLVDATAKMILQFASMAESECPELRTKGLAKIMQVAEFCIAGQFFLGDQKSKSEESRATIETDCGRTSLTKIACKLAQKRDALGDPLKPSELWPLYLAELDELGLRPQDDKLEVIFDGGRTTKDTFRATINRQRNPKKKKK